MLPDGDGFRLFQKLREKSQIPILFLSAKDEDRDRLFGWGWAQTIILRTFSAAGTGAAYSVILKRAYQFGKEAGTENASVLSLGECQVLFDYGTVRRGEKETALTAKNLPF